LNQSRWYNLRDLDEHHMHMLAGYVPQIICPNHMCIGGVVPDIDEENQPSITDLLGMIVVGVPVRPCPFCLGAGWMYAFCPN
jgi:hypothetical protein